MLNRSSIVFCLLLLAACSEVSEPATEQAASSGERAVAENMSQADERTALAANTALPQPSTEIALLDCQRRAAMDPYCGYQNPEDLVHLPGSSYLIVSEMGEFMADAPGALSLLNLITGQREPLAIDWAGDAQNWGDAECAKPNVAAFSPHGIDLVQRDDGDLSLLVVNHGGREAVEFFSVAASGDLAWRGCAIPPGDPFINDVAGRKDGGFYVTHMWDKTASFEATVAKLSNGEPTGWVWSWTADGGFVRLAESDDLMPNGIALSGDHSTLYVNVYMGNKTYALDLAEEKRIAEIQLRQPDNVTIDDEGFLWIASHQHDPIGQTCAQVTDGPCLLPFKIYKVDPTAFSTETVLDHNGSPMGFATVALKVDDRLYLGSAHGDRVVSVQLTN